MDRGRLEAFSDGVFAVAITLLALNLAVRGPGYGPLAHQLGDQWPAFVAYLISFFTIGIIWVNHHALVSNIAIVSRLLLFLNLVLLLFVVMVPFATKTVADYLAGLSAGHRRRLPQRSGRARLLRAGGRVLHIRADARSRARRAGRAGRHRRAGRLRREPTPLGPARRSSKRDGFDRTGAQYIRFALPKTYPRPELETICSPRLSSSFARASRRA
jgi:Endosomal/lysosomal potassium channel TMEM175